MPNGLRLNDMNGNVWEWCSDWWYDDMYLMSTPQLNPEGPPFGISKVIRGGCWFNLPADYVRSTARTSDPPDPRNEYGGFRLLLPPVKKTGMASRYKI